MSEKKNVSTPKARALVDLHDLVEELHRPDVRWRIVLALAESALANVQSIHELQRVRKAKMPTISELSGSVDFGSAEPWKEPQA